MVDSTATNGTTAGGKPFSRLPTDVKPTHYQLHLTSDLDNKEFTGEVTVTLEVVKQTSEIVFNVNGIEVTNASVSAEGGKSTQSDLKTSTDAKNETATVTLQQPLQAGTTALLTLKYKAQLSSTSKGWFIANYTTDDGVEHPIAATQFEPTSARQALPCWDEPGLKATYTVIISVPSKYTAISNMPEIDTSHDNGYTTHTFDKSPIMSTYLLAWVVGELEYIEGKTSDGKTTLRSYTAVGKKEQGRFALDTGIKCLEFYNKWFDEPYPLPKLDQVTVMNYSGAMENWGCITYSEQYMLVDGANTSSAAKELVASVVAHEIAHQWFGNLVTMDWWTDLWLNEGWASWMQEECSDRNYPDWGVWDHYVSSSFVKALAADSLRSSHQIQIEVGHPDEIQEVFDAITYLKGAAVIRMLHNFLGDEAFRQGMSTYIKKFRYQNTVTTDLWTTLQESSGKPVTQMMEAWTLQTGYPLLTVTDEPKIEGGKLVVPVKQERFLTYGPDKSLTESWSVPVSFRVAGSDKQLSPDILTGTSGTVSAATDLKQAPAWVKLNAGQTAMFRTKYTTKGYFALKEAIQQQDSALSAADRLGLENDGFALAKAGLVDTTQILELVSAFKQETDHTVWDDLASNLSDLAGILHDSPDTVTNYSKFVCDLVDQAVTHIGWDAKQGESHSQGLLRTTVIGLAAQFGHKAVVEESIKRYQAYAKLAVDKSKIAEAAKLLPPDLRLPVYTAVIAYGPAVGYTEAYETHLQLLKATDLNEEKIRILRTLGTTADSKLSQRTLDMAIDNNVAGSTQNALYLYKGVVDAPSGAGTHLLWQFYQKHWDVIVGKYANSFAITAIVQALVCLSDSKSADEIEQFFKTHEVPAGERSVTQTLESIRGNVQWYEREKEALSKWLQQAASGSKVACVAK